MNHRQGKIARLTAVVRDEVNRMLQDGKPYNQIIAWLREQGHGTVTNSGLTRWRQGGYHDWLTAQERLDDRQYKVELAQQQAASGDPVFHDAGVSIVAQEFYDAFSRLNFEELTAKARENPDKLIRLLQIFIQFNAYCLRRDKYRNDLTQQQKADEKDKPREPVTPENLDMLCEKYGLK